MRRRRVCVIPAAMLSFSAWFVLPSMAHSQEIKTTPVQLGDNVAGMLYEPVSPAAKSRVAVYVMHIGSDYTRFSACMELSRRGYRVLCARNSVGSAANRDGIDRKVLDAKLGVEYLRKYPGVRTIVLFGHSGGGMLMSAYQNIAENGLKACQGPEKIFTCSDSLAGLPPADGVMLIDAHYGDGVVNMLFGMSPSSASGGELNPDLDPYNPENELFSVPGAAGARLWSLDSRLLSHTHNAWPLLRPDEYLAAELIYQNAKSADKTIAFVEGASHGFTTCTRCEQTLGQYGDTQKTLYDYLDKWLSERGRF